MVELKVRKFGNSLGVVLPKEVISRLQTADGGALFLIEAPDGGCCRRPVLSQRVHSMDALDHCLLVVFRFGLIGFYLAAIGAQESACGFRLHLPLLTVRRHRRMGFRDDVLRVLDGRAPLRHHRSPAGGFAGGGKAIAVSILYVVDRAAFVRLRHIPHHFLPALRSDAAFGY